jgi:hypothetical protein
VLRLGSTGAEVPELLGLSTERWQQIVNASQQTVVTGGLHEIYSDSIVIG